MTEVNRPDVIAGRKLTDTFDIDAMNYHDIQIITHDFIKTYFYLVLVFIIKYLML